VSVSTTSYAPPVQRLVTELSKLPGIGSRTAQRLAFHILRTSGEDASALAQAIGVAKADAERALAAENFEAAIRAMAKLRPFVDAFFDKVTVNTDEKPVRANRLKILNEIRAATLAVADFSKIEG